MVVHSSSSLACKGNLELLTADVNKSCDNVIWGFEERNIFALGKFDARTWRICNFNFDYASRNLFRFGNCWLIRGLLGEAVCRWGGESLWSNDMVQFCAVQPQNVGIYWIKSLERRPKAVTALCPTFHTQMSWEQILRWIFCSNFRILIQRIFNFLVLHLYSNLGTLHIGTLNNLEKMFAQTLQ